MKTSRTSKHATSPKSGGKWLTPSEIASLQRDLKESGARAKERLKRDGVKPLKK